jgi:hypothetical protein
MAELAPLMRDQRKADAEHLQLLAIFNFVVAGLAVLGLGFLLLHYTVMHALIDNPGMWKNQKASAPDPRQFFALFKWFYIFFGAVLVVGGIGNLLSGLFLRRRRNRLFSLVVAGLNFIQFPFGTVLGVFTFIVLMRDSVREVYES